MVATDAHDAVYELLVRDQSGARDLVEKIGAFSEIETAVISHCQQTAPKPTYTPQAIKQLLAPHGWIPEVRVPPYDERYDDLPINDQLLSSCHLADSEGICRSIAAT